MPAQVEYLHVCDYAFPAQGGKPCVIGIFDQIGSQQFPTTHPMMCIAVQLRDVPHMVIPFRITIERQNGDVIAAVQGDTSAGNEGGAFVNANMIGVTFPEPARYTVRVTSLEETLAVQSIQVNQVRIPAAMAH